MLNETIASKNERVNATLAHASILLGFFSRGVLGIVLAFLIWITQRGKSEFAARQALQATMWQALGLLVGILAFVGWGIVFAGSIIVPLLVGQSDPESTMAYTMIPALAMLAIPVAIVLTWTAIGVYGAWQVWHGKDFAYPAFGRLIR